jgi:hypothetical protein
VKGFGKGKNKQPDEPGDELDRSGEADHPPAGEQPPGVPDSSPAVPTPPDASVGRRRHVNQADLEVLLGEVLAVIVQWSERQGHGGVPPQVILSQLNALTQAYGTALRPDGR